MNKSESKYFNTSLLMNQALIELLYKKDYDYITVKEICQKAGVNRSTFYLHYETINDLLEECIENTKKQFISYFNTKNQKLKDINNCSLEELVLLTPDYLTPYLQYIRENKKLYQVTVKKAKVMNSKHTLNRLSEAVIKPILNRFNIDETTQKYWIAYYIGGINSIICEWINNDCAESNDYITKTIIDCVRPYIGKNYEKA